MSQLNVDAVKRWIDFYNRRDLEGLIELTEPDFEFKSVFVAIESDFRGYERFPYAYFKVLDEAYDHFVVVPSEFIDAGAAVLVVANAEWRGKLSGAEGRRPIVTAFWLRAGKSFRAETFDDRADAFEAVGLSNADRLVSEPNVELANQVAEAVIGRDVTRLIELTDPEVEWRPFSADLREGGVYRGHDGVRQYVSDLDDAFQVWEPLVDKRVAVGSTVLMLGRLRYRGRGSGVETESQAGWLLKFREGRVIYVRAVRDPEQILEAAWRQ